MRAGDIPALSKSEALRAWSVEKAIEVLRDSDRASSDSAILGISRTIEKFVQEGTDDKKD